MEPSLTRTPLRHLPPIAANTTELFLSFQSPDEWRGWHEANNTSFSQLRESIVSSATSNGFIEPFTRTKRYLIRTEINTANLRESLSAGELNSRKRAGLYTLEAITSKIPVPQRRRLKILGAEGVTRTASILRSAFPFYLGCEYLPTHEERARYFPIPHLDLTTIDLPKESFDVFYSSDVFEHLSDLDKALTGVLSILRPGGLLVSVFPFLFDRDASEIRAILLPDGNVQHVLPPQYHGNPVRPNEGALVFSLPSWDLLERCRDIGFEHATMTLVASSFCAITANAPPGVFVLTATKQTANPLTATTLSVPLNTIREAPFQKVLGIAGLPRSGTTVLASLLSVHHRVHCVYEPWNSHKNHCDINHPATLLQFLTDFNVIGDNKDILAVKETATDIRYLQRLADVLRSTPYPLSADLLVIIRNPFHTFLSEVEARRDWWGEAGLELSCELFDKWAQRTISALRYIALLAREFDALLISYEGLVKDRLLIAPLMDALGVIPDVTQWEYEAHVRTEDVRGDVGLASSPRPLGAQAYEKRTAEREGLSRLIETSDYYKQLLAIEEATIYLAAHPLTRAHNATDFLKMLSTLGTNPPTLDSPSAVA